MMLPSNLKWSESCAADAEFKLASRHWQGGLSFHVGDQVLNLSVQDGQISDAKPTGDVLAYHAPVDVWDKLLAPEPARFHTDIFAVLSTGGDLTVSGDPTLAAQYYPAVMRAVELLRPPIDRPAAHSSTAITQSPSEFDSPVGRYVRLDLAGESHRIYFETAGKGIPLLLQHTAGCHGSQWRHLFEDDEIKQRFQLIAYDLPYHGKSLPPENARWWERKYDLTGDFLRAVPLALSEALELDRPAFMGCSVGGLLALDLAYRHADQFLAVISVEGALHIPGTVDNLQTLWHPQVSNDYKARAMEGLMAPQSPLPYVKETSFVYASGWPQSFLGDLYYYLEDYDLREVADNIDTNKLGVHILSGEYDHSGTRELGLAAHQAIPGSTFSEMAGVGHFPMSENPEAFIRYLRPILKNIS